MLALGGVALGVGGVGASALSAGSQVLGESGQQIR